MPSGSPFVQYRCHDSKQGTACLPYDIRCDIDSTNNGMPGHAPAFIGRASPRQSS